MSKNKKATIAWIVAVVAVWIAGIAALIAWGFARQDAAVELSPAVPECVTRDQPQERAVLTLSADGPAMVRFGRGLGKLTRQSEYTVAGVTADNITCVQVRVSPFLRDDTKAQLVRGNITAAATLRDGTMVLDVTFDRSTVKFGKGGTYRGTVSIVDPRFERIDVPMTVTLADPVWQFPAAAFLAVLLPAIGWLWLIRSSFQGVLGERPLTVNDLVNYLSRRNGLLAVGAGLAAAGTIFVTTYLQSDTWGADAAEVAALIAGLFTAFVAASSPVSAAGTDKSG